MFKDKQKILMQYTLAGVVFGIMFPIMAYLFEIYLKGLHFSFSTVIKIHSQNKLLYMIDTAPVFLGLFALVGGISKAKSEAMGSKLKEIISEKEVTEKRLKERSLLQKKILEERDYLCEKLYKNLYDISSSMKELKSKEIQMKHNTNNILNSTENNVRLSEQIFNMSYDMNNEMNQTVSGVNKTNDEIVGIIQALKSIENMMHNQMSEMDKLLIHSDRVTKVLDIINQLSKQIHFLSLNASLEAARAGNAGKGFNVVSNEIKDLALKTDEATKEIQQVISDMDEMVNLASDDIENISNVLEEKTLTGENTLNKLINLLTKFANYQNVLKEMHQLINSQENGIKLIEEETNDAHNLTEDMSYYLNKCNEAIEINEKMILQLKSQRFNN